MSIRRGLPEVACLFHIDGFEDGVGIGIILQLRRERVMGAAGHDRQPPGRLHVLRGGRSP